MVNFDEIEFLESEIVDDDPQAPVGTLVHILEDGTVEVVDTQTADVATPAQDVTDDITLADETPEQAAPVDEEVNQSVVAVDEEAARQNVEEQPTDETDSPVENSQPSVEEPVADEQVSDVEEPIADEENVDQTSVESEHVSEESENVVAVDHVDENSENVEETPSYEKESTDAVEDTANEIEEADDSSVENSQSSAEESVADEQVSDTEEAAANIEEPAVVEESIDQTSVDTTTEHEQNAENDTDETVSSDESVATVNDEPKDEQEVVAETTVEVATKNEVANGVVIEEIVPAPKKPRKKAVKKEETAVASDESKIENKTTINLKSGHNVNDALFDTSFEIEQPAKTKVVSTKKKQEKTEDLRAVAAVGAKPTKTTAKAKAEKLEKAEVAATTTEKKSAPKKSTKVENTSKNSTEEKKVAKTEAKTTKTDVTETKTDVKETKTETKNTKTAKAPVKEEKAPKAKTVEKAEVAPTKETKATKAAAKVDNDETVIVEGEGKTHGKYVIKKTDKGNFVFKLYSSNYRVVAIGAQAYTTLGAAKIGIQSIIKNAENAPIENQTLKNYETLKFPKWEIYLDKKGEYRLRLYATNGSLIATTNDGYTDISGAKNGIAAVGRASKGCAIVRNDNLW